jgi:hypothetical protein
VGSPKRAAGPEGGGEVTRARERQRAHKRALARGVQRSSPPPSPGTPHLCARARARMPSCVLNCRQGP